MHSPVKTLKPTIKCCLSWLRLLSFAAVLAIPSEALEFPPFQPLIVAPAGDAPSNSAAAIHRIHLITLPPEFVPHLDRVTESDRVARLLLRRSENVSANAVQIPYTVEEISSETEPYGLNWPVVPAKAGIDFIPFSGVADFRSGVVERQILIPLLDNHIPDGSRTFVVRFQEGIRYRLRSPNVYVEIHDDERILEYVELPMAPLRWVSRMFQQSDGAVLCLGVTAKEEKGIIQLRPDGTLNPDFGGGKGFVELDMDLLFENTWLDSADRLLIVNEYRLVRYLPDGELDASFTSELSEFWNFKLLFVPEGKIIIQAQGVGMVRLLESGAIDPSFNAPAWLDAPHVQFDPFPDGRLLVGSWALLPDGSPDPDFRMNPPFAIWHGPPMIDRWGYIYAAGETEGGSKAIVLRFHPDGSADAAFEFETTPGMHLRRQWDGRIAARSPDGWWFSFDEFGRAERSSSAPQILEASTGRGISLHSSSGWMGAGDGLFAAWLGVTAMQNGVVREQQTWHLKGIAADWLALDSNIILGTAEGFLVKVRVRDTPVLPRPARERQMTDANRPRVLLWRGSDPAEEETVQCTVTAHGSGETFTRTAIFPAGESMIWLELPELSTDLPAAALSTYTVRIGAVEGLLDLVSTSGLRPGALRMVHGAPEATGKAAIVHRRGAPDGPFILESSSTLSEWKTELEAKVEAEGPESVLWTVPLEKAKFFRSIKQ